jgi:hypothetical protein
MTCWQQAATPSQHELTRLATAAGSAANAAVDVAANTPARMNIFFMFVPFIFRFEFQFVGSGLQRFAGGEGQHWNPKRALRIVLWSQGAAQNHYAGEP